MSDDGLNGLIRPTGFPLDQHPNRDWLPLSFFFYPFSCNQPCRSDKRSAIRRVSSIQTNVELALIVCRMTALTALSDLRGFSN